MAVITRSNDHGWLLLSPWCRSRNHDPERLGDLSKVLQLLGRKLGFQAISASHTRALSGQAVTGTFLSQTLCLSASQYSYTQAPTMCKDYELVKKSKPSYLPSRPAGRASKTRFCTLPHCTKQLWIPGQLPYFRTAEPSALSGTVGKDSSNVIFFQRAKLYHCYWIGHRTWLLNCRLERRSGGPLRCTNTSIF